MHPRNHKRSQRKNKQTKRRSRNRHTKKAGKRQQRRYTLTGGSAGCEQAATVTEPGFTIASHIKDSTGLTIPSSRALLSGTLPICNKGAHP